MGKRYIFEALQKHLATFRQMAFLVGPRQVGKTTLAQSFLDPVLPQVNYFNWDAPAHRRILTTKILSGQERLGRPEQGKIVFDEIHKYPRWKNALKGLFDTHEPETHWIVTGSAMLGVYRRGQDSLLGRYFPYHLAPFSVAEVVGQTHSVPLPQNLAHLECASPTSEAQEAFQSLLRFGGFPEPLFRAEESFLSRWRTARLDRLINQDLASTEMIRQLPLVEHLMFLLPERVGSPLSLNNLREDLEVHFATVKHWMDLLQRVFYGFFIRPYAKKSARMLKKEAKWYLWDWTEITDPGTRFENLVAVHLKKYVDYLNDLGLGEVELHYVRDKEKREVDFLLSSQRKPVFLVECKLSERAPSQALGRFAKLLGVSRAVQLTEGEGPSKTIQEGITLEVLPAASFLKHLV